MAAKSQTNNLLGYPADARLLIINADDFGMCHAVNAAIVGALAAGHVRSTSVMVPCAWSAHASRYLAGRPDTPFAVHLTAIGDGADYRWGPVLGGRVPSLVDAGSRFFIYEDMPEFLVRVDLRELELEFRAQIEIVLGAGLSPTHLDWHSLRIADRPDIFAVMFRLAREYGLALRAAYRTLAEPLQKQGFPATDHELLDSYGLAATSKPATYARLLRELPPGLTEWAVHPGLDTPELLAIEPAANRTRQADYDFLVSQAAGDIIRAEGIILLDYRPLQAIWTAI